MEVLPLYIHEALENVMAVLTPSLATVIGNGQAVMMLGKVLLEMDNYIWRTPWYDNTGYMQEVDRRVAVETDKRKPPW